MQTTSQTLTRDFTKTNTEQLLRSYRFHDSDRGTFTVEDEIRRMSLVDEIGAELKRRGVRV
jgi:hypothetical protein